MLILKEGDLFDRRYRIQRRVGAGGMSYVFAAKDEELAETVALKVIKPDFALDEEFVTRFKREVRITRQIRHPNVVQVFEFGRTWVGGTELYYLTMELLKGQDLGAWLRAQKPAPLADVLRVGLQLCEALDEAHRAGVIHRDIKPQNIFVEPNDQVKLMDFGISRVTHMTSVTQGGKLIGTPRYMSPEQIHGRTSPDHRSDLYSVGIVLYELCTRRKPFDGENTIEIAMKQLQEMPQSPRQLNPRVLVALDQVIMKCLEKDPSDRFQSASELHDALEGILSRPRASATAKTVVGDAPPLNETERAQPPVVQPVHPPVKRPKPRPSRSTGTVRKTAPRRARPFVAVALALVALVTVGVLGVGLYRWLASPQSAEQGSADSGTAGSETAVPTTEAIDQPETAVSTTVPAERVTRPATTTSVSTEMRSSSSVEPTPKPAIPKGELRVTSNPTGAAVSIDGSDVGVTPWRGELTRGEHQLQVTHPGYSPVEQRVSILEGRELEQSLVLKPRQTNVEVRVSANPGTEIYVDGELAGKSIVRLTLPSGRHVLRYVLPEYDEYQETVDVLPNQENRFSHRFPLFGSLRILAVPYAQVHLDGKDMGFTPVNADKIPEGEHELILTREGFQTIQTKITVKPGEVNRFNYELNRS
jgi:serine/threonine protein kinase